MSVAGKRTLAVTMAELRLGCDLVREARAGPTGTAAAKGMTRCTSGPCSMMTTAPARNWKQAGSWA